MKNQDPEIILFKSGYEWDALFNNRPGPHADAGPPVRTSEWNGKTIALKKWDGDLKQYGSFVSGVLTGTSWGGCGWKKIPRMMVALDRESERLWQLKIFNNLPTIRRVENTAEGENCGSVQEFFKEYLK